MFVAGMTLTYSDIFGRKHAAIFDLSPQRHRENVAYLRNIHKDSGELEHDALQAIPVPEPVPEQVPALPDIPRTDLLDVLEAADCQSCITSSTHSGGRHATSRYGSKT